MSVFLSAPGMVSPRGHGAAYLAQPASASERWFDPALHLAGRKSRYLSRATRYLLACSEQTLQASGELFGALPRERKGIVVGTNFADYAVRHEFDHLLLASGSGSLNSIQAPNVSINMPATQTAIAHRWGGVCATLTTSGIAGIEAILYANNAIASERVDAVLVGSTEDNGSDDSRDIVLPDVLPGSCTLAAFSAAVAARSDQDAYEIAGWHWRRYGSAAVADAARAKALRGVFTRAIGAMLEPGLSALAVCWPHGDAVNLTLQSWLYAALDSARIDAHPIDSPPAMAWSGAGCNTALMSLQYAMQTAGRPLLFVASHPMGNLVVLYLKPRFSH